MVSRVPVFIRKQIKKIPGARLSVNYLRGMKTHHDPQSRLVRALPSIVAIELTNTCNLRCAKCPLVRTSRARGFIDDGLFGKILQDIEAAGAPTEIALSGAGEPTLHPRVVDYVKAARMVPNVGVIGFATNGVALNPDLSQRLLDAGLTRLKASLDTDDREEYKRFNGRDAYEQAAANFLRFCEINRATGNHCRVTLKATLYNNDLSLARRLKERWAPHVYQVRVTPVHNWGGAREKGSAPLKIAPRPCSMPWQQIQILWDGQISLCCMDSMEGRFNMGNAHEINLSRYWQHDPGLIAVRKQHQALDLSALPVCAECDILHYHDIDL
jgi:sulfatase maturation enzyme AslB (radical SAM superfamily)